MELETRRPGTRITRKQRHLRVPVLPEEAQAIKAQAQAVGLPVAAYSAQCRAGHRA